MSRLPFREVTASAPVNPVAGVHESSTRKCEVGVDRPSAAATLYGQAFAPGHRRSGVEDRAPQAVGPDADRVRAALAGDPAAFGDPYYRHAPGIRAVCHDVPGHRPEVKYLGREVYMRASRTLATLRDAERFAGWLVGIARMTCREWRKQAARDRRHRRARPPGRGGPRGRD